MDKYLLIPLEDTVVFPDMTVTLPLDTGDEDRVLLVPRHEGVYAEVGTIAEVVETARLPGGAPVATLSGLYRALIGAAETGSGGRLYVEVEERPDETPPPVKTRELETEYRAVVQEILELRDADPRIAEFLRSVAEPGALADTAAYAPDLSFEQRVDLLETVDVVERLELALSLQRDRLAELQVHRRIRDDVESGAQAQQREYFLRKQMDSIRKELGEDEGLGRRRVPHEDRRGRHARRGSRAGRARARSAGADGRRIRRSVDDPDIPGLAARRALGQRSDERLDPKAAREILDADHAGLDDVKERIVEYLAVRKLRQERGIAEDKRSGAILTLIGPPGTGKTSIGESIARALNREFVRMSLGGVRDEAEIRGHRRTYIGALPGRSCGRCATPGR